MKTIKFIYLFATISFFALIPLNVEARDCSDPKGFHEKMMCKIEGKDFSLAEKKKDNALAESTESGEKGNIIGDIFKKIKHLGGKNIGEEG
tara:strand:+ start:168 stop:440 length:273 start_codon:yes stop_codon:yes gene_type:complete